jgi:hypothetical protein
MMKDMKLFNLLLIISAFFFASCATTTVTDVWQDKTYQGKAEKIIVIIAAKSLDRRKMFEDRFTAELQKRGNNAIQSYEIITSEQLPDKELVKSKIQSTGADTVLISRLVDTKTIEAYMPSTIYVVPDFYNGWGTYHDFVFAGRGYTGDVQVANIETNVYDLKTEKLIWSAHSSTERTEGEQQRINVFIQVMMKKLSSSGIIK